MTKQEALKILESNRAYLKEFHVSSLSLFGSVARDEATPGSDIDILVEFDKDARVGLFELFRLKTYLSKLLGTEIDLVTPDALHPLLRDDILREAIHAT